MDKPIFNFKGSIEFDERVVVAEGNNLRKYIEVLQDIVASKEYLEDEASLSLPGDEGILHSSLHLANEYKAENLKYVFVVGIGGSNLGTQAIYTALRGQFDYLEHTFPKIIFIDAVSYKNLNQINRVIDDEGINAEDFVIFAISKSGGTSETIANTNFLIQVLDQYLEIEPVRDRLIVITDEGSKFWERAEKENIDKLPIPKKVGGRYSVFSNVGIAPLSFIFGEDLKDLIHGARVALEDCIQFEFESNPALQSALVTNLYLQKGTRINNNFFFDPNLEYVGKWYRQLMGESIGKERSIKNKIVHAGITPIVSIGSTDLHSMAQLYIGGPNDKLTNFVYVDEEDDLKVSEYAITKDLVDDLEGKSAYEINKAIYEGVKKAYIKNERPFVEVVFLRVSLFTLGYYLQFKMVEMMYLANLMNLNAFDQPNVEDYKEETRKLLKG